MRQANENKIHIVNSHHDLQALTQEELGTQGAKVVADANQGIQTAIIAADGRVRAVVGLNCVRYLPNADPDPLEELAWTALKSQSESESK